MFIKLTESELNILHAVYKVKNDNAEIEADTERDIQEYIEINGLIDLGLLKTKQTEEEWGIITETETVDEIFESLRNKGLVKDDDRISVKGNAYIERLNNRKEILEILDRLKKKIDFKKIAAAITGICGVLVAVIELIKLITER